MSSKGAEMKCCEFKKQPNNAINADLQKSCFALYLHAGYGEH